jgi:hypothetical protein
VVLALALTDCFRKVRGRLLFVNKKKQKNILCWAEGLKVPTVRSTVRIAPEGMGVGGDIAKGPA